MLVHIRAAVVRPFEHNGLAPEIAELYRLAIRVYSGEIGRGLARFGDGNGYAPLFTAGLRRAACVLISSSTRLSVNI